MEGCLLDEDDVLGRWEPNYLVLIVVFLLVAREEKSIRSTKTANIN